MNFMQFLKSLDDLLYEIITWLVFWPVTFWRTIRTPFAMMVYADSELDDAPEQQYVDVLSPPLFLLLTLLMSHAIELAVVGQSELVASRQGLAGLINDDTSLLLVRLVFFAIFPLIMSLGLLRRKKQKLTRDSLRSPFYAQCYPTGVFALALGIGTVVTQLHAASIVRTAGGLIMLAAFLWYGTLQSLWFARMLNTSRLRGFLTASRGMIEGGLAFVLFAALIL